jgi:predicted nucleic acid-binding protein
VASRPHKGSPTTAVVDASFVLRALVDPVAAAPAVAAAGDLTLVAPAQLDGEVLAAVSGLVRAGLADERVAGRCPGLLARLPVRRVPASGLLADAWTLRRGLTPQSAIYVALARRLGCPLLTADGRLAAARQIGIPVALAH